ncbi:ATPase, F1 complex, epsilon subunit, mitochondrial family-containing protein [Strongyloides ratti]|uniref:ATPase, F1 complex, epsilon subunit, mitochondrial family-containing protein n=1 Tax=Strongyloides ratti TaxID=34506 RepID=A0A090LD00_STRRB|nr:ATPase, F1 complex, epsilon subunit, mitochondrial family-containing protein [Strongyloides ratti]CEF65390.1 ATPase, F1 complex, epsilon subunit, mitochondrial family-containing protein [Strongyloides ratti]
MFWRNAGLTYLNYSRIAAKVVSKCTKSAQGKTAPEGALNISKWENGKIVPKKSNNN